MDFCWYSIIALKTNIQETNPACGTQFCIGILLHAYVLLVQTAGSVRYGFVVASVLVQYQIVFSSNCIPTMDYLYYFDIPLVGTNIKIQLDIRFLTYLVMVCFNLFMLLNPPSYLPLQLPELIPSHLGSLAQIRSSEYFVLADHSNKVRAINTFMIQFYM